MLELKEYPFLKFCRNVTPLEIGSIDLPYWILASDPKLSEGRISIFDLKKLTSAVSVCSLCRLSPILFETA